MRLTLRCVIYIINSVLYFSTVTGVREETWTFPDELLIGTGTSAYQIEGAWNFSDKGENVWDKYTHDHPDRILNQENGDIACDSYHKFKEDVQLIKQMGMNHYRFSLSWSRILPTGYPNIISKDGVKYYNALLDELEKNNIIPFVTLYHWDHPQIFQDMGGWTNEAMIDMFVDYARVVFQLFGNRVKIFSTINEPYEVCQNGLFAGTLAPGLKLGKHAVYLCTHNILKAHARVYHMYDDEFRAQQNGKVGIVLNTFNYYSIYENDNISNEIAFQFKFGIFGNAIFSKEGDYPAVVKHQIAENSKYEGLLRSRLPTFSKSWIEYIRGTADYLGLNSYSSILVEPAPKSNYTIYANDDGLLYSYDDRWPKSASNWLRVVPEGFLDLLKKIKNDYGNPLVFVTENGVSDFGTVEDDQRIEYLYSYMKAMLTAIKKYGCNVKAYTIWSLLDNFEWSRGYSEKFGLFHVDFSHPNRIRTPKKSVHWLTKVLRTRKLQPITIKKKYSHNVIYAQKDDWNIPSGFSIGCATSAYQIEGAWNIGDKGESVWDRYTHTKSDKIVDKSNGDIACDSYNKFKEDVRLLKQLGVNHYRFSLSWPRILPTGYANVVNKEGIKYYNDLLDELKNNNITPFVTLYHWDHPQVFQEIGGWTNEAIVDLFGDYARVVFKELGHRIKVFATINEPSEVCKEGYYTGNYAPGLKIGKYAEYLCTHNIIKAHARAYHIYNDEFKAHQKGKIGIVLNCDNAYSRNKNDNISDEVAFQYKCGRYGSPIFSETGDYPDIIKKRIAENSKYEGLERSRLPTFSEEWINYIRGTADYYGLNHYHTYLVEQAPKPNDTIYVNDDGLTYGFDPNWPSTPIETVKIVPDGLRDLLRKIKKEYGNPPVYIMENGIADLGTLEDDQRIQYLYLYMKAVFTAINYYNCNIKAYTIWSLIDNFEWERGYSIKYGIFSVNFNDPNRTRSPKKSVSWLSNVLHTSKLQPNF